MKKKLKGANGNDDSFKGGSITKGKNKDAPVEIALKKIKEMMYLHELIPGQKLIYRDLAKKFNMSITPVIQALNKLETLNIVQSVRNSGFSVGESDPVEVGDLFSAREVLEVYLIPAIVEKMTEEKLNSIEVAMKEHVNTNSSHEYRRFLMIKDSKFHLKMIECSENKVFYNICEMVFEQVYLKYRPEYIVESRSKEAAKEHQMILDAIKKRDVKRAKRLLRQHIRIGSKHIVACLWKGKSTDF